MSQRAIRNTILTAMLFCVILLIGIYPLYDIFTDFPLSVRESANVSITWQIKNHGIFSIYQDNSVPQYLSVYGAGFSLFALPFTYLFSNIVFAHRVASFFACILASIIIFLTSKRLSKNDFVALGTTLVFALNIKNAGLFTSLNGDSFGLFIALLPLYALIKNKNSSTSFVVLIISTALAALTKLYFAFHGILLFGWMMIALERKLAMRRLIITASSAIIFIIIIELIYPWYFWSTFIQYSAYLGGNTNHLLLELKTFYYNNYIFLISLAAVCILNFLLPKLPTENKNYFKDRTYRGLSFIAFQLMFFSIVFFYMGKNTGTDLNYISETLAPSLLLFYCYTARLLILKLKKLKNPYLSNKVTPNIYAVSNLIFFFLISNNDLSVFNNSVRTAILKPQSLYQIQSNIISHEQGKFFAVLTEKYAGCSKNIFHSSWLTGILLDKNMNIYDSGHSQHFIGPVYDNSDRKYFGLSLEKLVPKNKRLKAEKLWNEYWDDVKKNIRNHQFDLISLEERNFAKESYLMMWEYGSYYDHKNIMRLNEAIDDFYDLIEQNYKLCETIEWKPYAIAIYRPFHTKCACS